MDELAQVLSKVTPEQAKARMAEMANRPRPAVPPTPEEIEDARQAMMLPNPREELLGGPLEK